MLLLANGLHAALDQTGFTLAQMGNLWPASRVPFYYLQYGVFQALAWTDITTEVSGCAQVELSQIFETCTKEASLKDTTTPRVCVPS